MYKPNRKLQAQFQEIKDLDFIHGDNFRHTPNAFEFSEV